MGEAHATSEEGRAAQGRGEEGGGVSFLAPLVADALDRRRAKPRRHVARVVQVVEPVAPAASPEPAIHAFSEADEQAAEEPDHRHP